MQFVNDWRPVNIGKTMFFGSFCFGPFRGLIFHVLGKAYRTVGSNKEWVGWILSYSETQTFDSRIGTTVTVGSVPVQSRYHQLVKHDSHHDSPAIHRIDGKMYVCMMSCTYLVRCCTPKGWGAKAEAAAKRRANSRTTVLIMVTRWCSL